MKILKREFYSRDSAVVAREMLGKILVRKTGKGRLMGRIVETEAYYGKGDPASRSFRGKKKYNLALWEEPGTIFVYNVHNNWMFCIVTSPPGAILIRAIQPIHGIEEMKRNRKEKNIFKLSNGPGKLSRALGITKDFNFLKVTDENSPIFITDSNCSFKVGRGKRIGVSEDLPRKLRFYIKGSRFLSRI
jgi:DNA-3-methyladenine glycosylase